MEINGNVQETWEQKKHDNVVEFDVALDEEKEKKGLTFMWSFAFQKIAKIPTSWRAIPR